MFLFHFNNRENVLSKWPGFGVTIQMKNSKETQGSSAFLNNSELLEWVEL